MRVFVQRGCLAAGISLILGAASANAGPYYGIQLDLQRLALGDPAVILDQLREVNGRTAIEIDGPPITGLAGTADAFARGDIATGSIQLGGSASVRPGFESVASTASAQIFDTLRFHLPAGMSSATISASMKIEGTFTPDSGCGAFARLILGVVTVSVPQHYGVCENVFGQTIFAETIVNDDQETIFDMSMVAGIVYTGTFDARHTATVSLRLPAGVTYSSASNVFLSRDESPTPVTEPATMNFLLTGLVGVGVGCWRRPAHVPDSEHHSASHDLRRGSPSGGASL